MNKKILGLGCLLAVLLVGFISVSFAAPGGTVSQGNVSVFKDGKLNKKLSGTSPVEEGTMLVCEGKCMIKSHGVSFLAEDKAELAVTDQDQILNLFVRRGHVEFIISAGSKKLAFHTPEGIYSVADVIFNASTDPVVRGYMQVDDTGTRVGVREGRMVFSTADGAKSVKANQHIILAMAEVKKDEKKKSKKAAAYILPAGSGATSMGMTKGLAFASGVVVAGITTGALFHDGEGRTRSPSPSK